MSSDLWVTAKKEDAQLNSQEFLTYIVIIYIHYTE